MAKDKSFKWINYDNWAFEKGILIPKFTIGIDQTSYVITRTLGETTEVVLAKTLKDEKAFKEEVENLAKYFNANIIKEV